MSVRSTGSGRYRQRVTVQRPTIVLDSYRQPIESFASLFTISAQVIPQGGTEAPVGDQVFATSTYVVKFRYMGSTYKPQANDRVMLADGTHLNVINANNVELRNREWVLTCGQISQPPGN